MKVTKKLIFICCTCAFLVVLGSISAQAQPARPRPGADVLRRDNVTKTEGATEQNGFELLCRGGANAFTFEEVLTKPLPGGLTLVVLRARFNASPRPAGDDAKGLAPGTCSAIDRLLTGKEPKEIWFETVANAQLKQKLQGVPVDTSPTAAETYPDAITVPAYLTDEHHYWRFFVVNAMSQYFSAQSHGPWKRTAKGLVLRPNQGTRDPALRSRP